MCQQLIILFSEIQTAYVITIGRNETVTQNYTLCRSNSHQNDLSYHKIPIKQVVLVCCMCTSIR